MRNLIRKWLGLGPLREDGFATASQRGRAIDDVLMHNTQAVYEAYLIQNGFLLRMRHNDLAPNTLSECPTVTYCKNIAELCDALVRDSTVRKISGDSDAKDAQLSLPYAMPTGRGARPFK